jgi:hypothetical protein
LQFNQPRHPVVAFSKEAVMEATVKATTQGAGSQWDGVLDDDYEVIETLDWRERIEPFMQETIVAVTARDYRPMFGRPFRLLREMAGLSREECAEIMGWEVSDVEAAEERMMFGEGAGNSMLGAMTALTKMALALTARCDAAYARKVWAPALGDEFSDDKVGGVKEFIGQFSEDRAMLA